MSRPATRGAQALLPFVLPLTKVNAATGEFWAKAALEVRDGAGEMFDYASSRPYFDKLIARSLEDSGGKKEAPLRVMHQLTVAAGKIVKHHFDDAAREVSVHGQITDAGVLAKVLDGTLCGISMGGKKRYLGFDGPTGARRYTAIPYEHSLVDLGEIPQTGLTMLNAAGQCEVVSDDGTVRLLKSYAEGLPDGEAPASLAHLVDTADHHIRHGAEHNAKAAETLDKIAEVLPVVSPEAGTELGKVRGKRGQDKPMAQAAGGEKDPDKPYGDVKYAKPAEGDEPAKYPVDTPAHIRAAWSYAHKYHESSKVLRAIIAAWKAQIDAAGPPGMEKAIIGSVLAKNAGFDLVARTAQIVGELSYLAECQEAEEAKEGDAAAEALCAQYARAIRALGDCLVAMTVEEVDELGDESDAGAPDGEAIPMANAADAMRGLKGRMQKMHNMSVEMGAACAPPMEKTVTTATATENAAPGEEDAEMTEQELQKAVGTAVEAALGLNQPTGETPLQKAIGAAIGTALDLGNAESPLAKAIGGAVTASVTPKLDDLGKRLKALEDKPEPAKGVVMSLSKAADSATAAALESAALDTLAKSQPAEFVKLMQREGGFRVTAQGLEPIAPPA